MLETGVQMGLEAQLSYHVVVMAIDVGINSVKSFEYLSNQTRKCLWEWDTCCELATGLQCCFTGEKLTNAARKHLLVVDVALDPCHEMLYVFWSGHLGWPFEVLVILPKVLKPLERQTDRQRSQLEHTHP